MQKNSKPGGQRKLAAIVIVTALAIGAYLWLKPPVAQKLGTTFVVKRGNLPINVVEGGSVEALESQEIRSEYKGYQGTKILSIVEEGYLVTEEDVKNEKVLVELDSSELKQKITTQDIQFQSTIASLTEAKQSYDIQYNQNKSDIKSAEQKVRFARMDLEKFLGTEATEDVISQMTLMYPAGDTNDAIPSALLPTGSKAIAAVTPNNVTTDVPQPSTVTSSTNQPATATKAPIDFSKYAKVELLGDGEAMQKLRKFEDDLLVAKSEHGLSQTQFEGTRRLSEKGFVTKNTLANEEIAVKKNDLKVQTAATARDLFIKYEFPKAAEEFLSKYEEAARLLDRTRKEAISKLAQAEAKLKSAEGRHRIEKEQRDELQEQLAKCVIRAKKTGLVVYGGGNENFYYGGQEQIREGATVRERQPIITIPDMTQMSIKVKIHESHIKKVKKGMKARIRVDAFPDEVLTGEVIKVGVLPDSQNRWMNPDLKVYVTSIKIDGVRDWVKPGMSAKVEVLINELADVVQVPLQAVHTESNSKVAYLVDGTRTERRVIEIGEFNDEFIEIKSGLKEGDKVLLRAPVSDAGAASPEKEESTRENAPAATPAPTSA
ncbi:MAG: efflux RND transporter periplasmic adaptor subunit [Verrucomicrobiota bacterium]|nr:efflux RND transporter periplasmic adaptor subunit [Verrucomicrobiota bacterium]